MPDTYKTAIGFMCGGISLFVLFALLAFAASSVEAKQNKGSFVKSQPADYKKARPQNDKYAKKDKPAPAKNAVKNGEKTEKIDKIEKTEKIEKIEKPVDKPAAAPKELESSDERSDENMLRRDNGEQITEESGPSTLYVSNLAADVSEIDLREEFEVFGTVKSVRLVTDKETAASKGYAFVEMTNRAEASLAIDDINGQEIKGQQVSVSFARKKTSFNRKWTKK